MAGKGKQTYYVVDRKQHDELVAKLYMARGFDAEESAVAARYAGFASWHGIRTHAALKALHLEHLFGQSAGLAKPGAKIERIDSPYKAVVKLNGHYKLGQPIASEAMRICCELADEYGVGMVAVDQPFHYLWGGGYVLETAQKGYIAYTNCTAGLAEVVPFGGKYPTIGTNPHSWAFPTQDLVGFPILVDWATSAVAMGKVQQLKREGQKLPPEVAIDKDGRFTDDPNEVFGVMPFGGKQAGHKGYGLGLIIELYGAYIGGSLPTLRGPNKTGHDKKRSSCYLFQAIKPDALAIGSFDSPADRDANVKAVIEDMLGHGNEGAILPGQIEANNARLSEQFGGLLFTPAEMAEFAEAFQEAGIEGFSTQTAKKIEA